VQDPREIQELIQKGLKELQTMKVRGTARMKNIAEEGSSNPLGTEANCYQSILPTRSVGSGGW
jgi:hypothetical protein